MEDMCLITHESDKSCMPGLILGKNRIYLATMTRIMPSHHGSTTQFKKGCPNETMKILMERASCRNFSRKKIPTRLLNLILSAGTHAATGGNLQPYSIIKILNEKTRKKLARYCGQRFISQAPVSLLFCIDWHRLKKWSELETAPFTATSSFRHFWISFQDTVICAQSVCTAADACGMGSVYIGTVLEFFPLLKKMFKLPAGVFPVVLLCLGYPASKLVPRRKLGIDVIVHAERYRKLPPEKIIAAYSEKYPFKIEITRDRLALIKKVCTETMGSEFAERCLRRIRRNSFINPAQRYFGLHYIANLMPEGNDKYLKIMEKFGFEWFKKYVPIRRKSK
jgi:FMN reductase [NAD(P)H]